MLRPKVMGPGLGALVVCTLALTSPLQASVPPDPVKIGMVQSLFENIPSALVELFSQPFSDLTRQFTGLNGQLKPGGDHNQVARDLEEGRLHLAVFHGYEFAWVQQKYPNLKPLMVAINRHHHVRAHLVAPKESNIKCLADLRGKNVALPCGSKEHCRLFLNRLGKCREGNFFGKVTSPANAEVALDEVLLGDVQAACVDTLALDLYQVLKPGCFDGLTIIQSSENFPPGCIAYRQGFMDEGTLNRFRDGMLSANKNEEAQNHMRLMRVTSFEPVPGDYAQNLAEIFRAYPPPAPASKVSLK